MLIGTVIKLKYDFETIKGLLVQKGVFFMREIVGDWGNKCIFSNGHWIIDDAPDELRMFTTPLEDNSISWVKGQNLIINLKRLENRQQLFIYIHGFSKMVEVFYFTCNFKKLNKYRKQC